MSRVRRCLFLLVCLSFWPGLPLRGEPPEAGDQDRVAAVLDKAIRARGGEAALARFPATTWKGKATIRVGDKVILSSDEGAQQLPERMWGRSTFEDQGTQVEETVVVAGDQGWTVSNGRTEPMTKQGVAEQRERLYAEWLGSLTPLKGKGFRLTSLGESRVGDRAAVGVLVRREGHRDVKLFFDRDSGLLLKRENRIEVVQVGREFTQEVFFSNYQEIGGVKYPLHRTIRAGDEFRVEADLTEVKPCEKLEADLFTAP